METLFKTFRPEIKAVDAETGIIDMLIPMSTSSVDRDGESIDPLGWKKSLPAFRKRPVLLSSHDYRDLRKQIGEFTSVKITEDGLFAKPKYYIGEGNEEADWGFKLASKGMAAFSVGFIPKSWIDGDGEKEPKRTYTEQELLEISQVVVPSNRDAIQGIRGKSADPMINQLVEDIIKLDWPKDADEIIALEEELITKPEETADFIHIPVSQCNITATIDISKKEGISAKYCGQEKQIATYMFDKRDPYNWTMERAQKWVKDHEKSIIIVPEPKIKGAIPYRQTPLDESGEWDAGAEVKDATVDDLKIMCAIVEGDPENKTSYKLSHHRVGGEHTCVWAGVRAAAAVLMGSRGGVDAPEASISGAKTHIGKHYADFDKGNPPWEKSASQHEIADELDFARLMINDNGLNEETKVIAWDLVHSIMRLTGDDIPADIRKKFAISSKLDNQDILDAIKRIAQRKLEVK